MSAQDLRKVLAEKERAKERWRARTQMVVARAEWEYFCTLTFKRVVPRDVAVGSLREWLRQIAKTWQTHVDFAYGVERRPEDGRIDVHALLASRGPRMQRSVVHGLWTLSDESTGHADIRKYDSARNGAAYVVKYDDYQINVACPRILSRCRRSAGCVEAPGSWH